MIAGLGEVPMLLQDGEGVLSRDGMAALSALNDGRTPRADMRGVEERLDRLAEENKRLRLDLSRQSDVIRIAFRRHSYGRPRLTCRSLRRPSNTPQKALSRFVLGLVVERQIPQRGV